MLTVFYGAIFPGDADTYLQKGLQLEEQGKPEQALKLWDGAVNSLDDPSVAIATEYLRVATEHELMNYYRPASSTYMSEMSGSGKTAFQTNRSELERELLRLEPIMDRNEFSTCKKLLDGNDPELFKRIKGFWTSLDPTPDTAYNERLIEHWQRISYSREHFTRKKDLPYGTDDRGNFYVKYGEPDNIDKGRVRITHDTIQTVLNQLMPTRSSGGNNFGLMKVSNRIQNLFVNPEYELWIYDTPGENMTENMVLIFGHRSGGSFARLETLEDFIPESAFNLRVQRSVDPGLPPVPAGMVLQWLYYEYFAKKEPYFARLFSEYYSTMQRYIGIRNGSEISAPPPDPFSMQLTKNQNIVSAYQANRRAPDKFSTEEKKIPDIPIKIHQYRMLDESNQPVFVTFLESRPLQAFLTDYTVNEDIISQSSRTQMRNEENNAWYNLIHGIQLRDENWSILAENSQSPRLVFYEEEPFISSVFEIPWGGNEINQIFYAKLLNTDPDSKPRVESIFSDSLRGLGKLQIEQPEPLKVEARKMVMSDLILGYQKTEQTDNQSFFDFVAANDRRIPEGENLVIHFELYELQTNSTGMSHFEVAYEITPKSGLLGWIKRKRDEFTITLEFDNYGDRFSESLEIDAEGLDPDEYELTWTATDLENGRIQKQQINFEVFESSDSILSKSSVD